jgi:hypothetical protein
VEFTIKINLRSKPVKPEGLGGSAGFRIKFIFVDPAETLVQRGFRKSGLRKIRFSKNLDIKILRTKSLAGQVSRWADRHCLDHDRASSAAAQGWMSHWGCGNIAGRVSKIRPEG